MSTVNVTGLFERISRIESQQQNLSEKIATFSENLNKIFTSIHDLRNDFAKSRETNWGTILSFAGCGFVLVGFAGSIIMLMCQSMISPINEKTAVSLRDRQELREQVSVNTISIANNKAIQDREFAANTQKLIEIETQFRALDQIRNQQMTMQHRVNALLWRKSYKEDYPETFISTTMAQPK